MSLRNIFIILKREVRTFFSSPIAYIVMTLFLLLTGWFFFSTFFLAGRADMRDFFNLLPVVFTFIILLSLVLEASAAEEPVKAQEPTDLINASREGKQV